MQPVFRSNRASIFSGCALSRSNALMPARRSSRFSRSSLCGKTGQINRPTKAPTNIPTIIPTYESIPPNFLRFSSIAASTQVVSYAERLGDLLGYQRSVDLPERPNRFSDFTFAVDLDEPLLSYANGPSPPARRNDLPKTACRDLRDSGADADTSFRG